MTKYYCDKCNGLLKDSNLYEGKPHFKIMLESMVFDAGYQCKELCQECYQKLLNYFKD